PVAVRWSGQEWAGPFQAVAPASEASATVVARLPWRVHPLFVERKRYGGRRNPIEEIAGRRVCCHSKSPRASRSPRPYCAGCACGSSTGGGSTGRRQVTRPESLPRVGLPLLSRAGL